MLVRTISKLYFGLNKNKLKGGGGCYTRPHAAVIQLYLFLHGAKRNISLVAKLASQLLIEISFFLTSE